MSLWQPRWHLSMLQINKWKWHIQKEPKWLVVKKWNKSTKIRCMDAFMFRSSGGRGSNKHEKEFETLQKKFNVTSVNQLETILNNHLHSYFLSLRQSLKVFYLFVLSSEKSLWTFYTHQYSNMLVKELDISAFTCSDPLHFFYCVAFWGCSR